MKAIIIGAGRGNRLMPVTDDIPKCLAEVGGRRVFDHMLEALAVSGVDDVVFIGGYQMEKVKASYPQLRFCHNVEWPDNNILASLFYAAEDMNTAFVASYSDILYRPSAVRKLMQSDADIALVVDTDWRTSYVGRSLHPESQAEKVIVEAGKVIRIGKHLDADQAYGEFIGLAKFSVRGAEILRMNYYDVLARYDGRPFQKAPVLKHAYLTDMIQELIDRGYDIGHVDIAGDWMEIDTKQDYDKAKREWK